MRAADCCSKSKRSVQVGVPTRRCKQATNTGGHRCGGHHSVASGRKNKFAHSNAWGRGRGGERRWEGSAMPQSVMPAVSQSPMYAGPCMVMQCRHVCDNSARPMAACKMPNGTTTRKGATAQSGMCVSAQAQTEPRSTTCVEWSWAPFNLYS